MNDPRVSAQRTGSYSPLKPPIKDWMRKAANEIDIKLGLSRHDMAIEWAAEIIAKHYAFFVLTQASPPPLLECEKPVKQTLSPKKTE